MVDWAVFNHVAPQLFVCLMTLLVATFNPQLLLFILVQILFGRQQGCHLKIASAHATRGGHAVRVVLEQFHPESTWVENFRSGSQILQHLRKKNSTLKPSDSPSPSSTPESHKASQGPDLLPMRNSATTGVLPDPDRSFQGSERRSSPVPEVVVSRAEFEIPSPGLHLAINACAAAAVATSLGMPLRMAGRSFSKYSPIAMRSRLEVVGGIQLLDDTYNSNPMSLEAGLHLLGSMECEGERVALLGDMLELGSVRRQAHLDALALCKNLNIHKVGLVGPSFSEAARSPGLEKGNCEFAIFQDSEELAANVGELVRRGDVVLVKGSRGMEMEIAANVVRNMARLGFSQYSDVNLP